MNSNPITLDALDDALVALITAAPIGTLPKEALVALFRKTLPLLLRLRAERDAAIARAEKAESGRDEVANRWVERGAKDERARVVGKIVSWIRERADAWGDGSPDDGGASLRGTADAFERGEWEWEWDR